MSPRGALVTLALASMCGCTVYDQSLLSPGAPPDETTEDASTGAGGTVGTGGASLPKDGATDAKTDVSVVPDSGADGAGGAGGAGGTGGASGAAGESDCATAPTGHATLTAGPILATFELGTHEEQEVTPYMYWYAYGDGTGETGSPLGPFFASAREPVEDGNRYAGHFTGSGHTSFGGGIGIACTLPIDASAYTGLSFWAKGAGPMHVIVTTTATDGNYCICAGSDCGDGYLKNLTLTADWAQYTVLFTDLKQMHHAVPFDPTAVIGFNFASNANAWDYWIDDVAFSP